MSKYNLKVMTICYNHHDQCNYYHNCYFCWN